MEKDKKDYPKSDCCNAIMKAFHPRWNSRRLITYCTECNWCLKHDGSRCMITVDVARRSTVDEIHFEKSPKS